MFMQFHSEAQASSMATEMPILRLQNRTSETSELHPSWLWCRTYAAPFIRRHFSQIFAEEVVLLCVFIPQRCYNGFISSILSQFTLLFFFLLYKNYFYQAFQDFLSITVACCKPRIPPLIDFPITVFFFSHLCEIPVIDTSLPLAVRFPSESWRTHADSRCSQDSQWESSRVHIL